MTLLNPDKVLFCVQRHARSQQNTINYLTCGKWPVRYSLDGITPFSRFGAAEKRVRFKRL